MGWQIPIITEGNHNNSRIINMSTDKINEYLNNGEIVIMAGFQGISKIGDLTTLGRGGSDLSAVAVAKLLNTDSL